MNSAVNKFEKQLDFNTADSSLKNQAKYVLKTNLVL